MSIFSPNSHKILYKGFVSLTERIEKEHPYITVHTKPLAVMIIPRRMDGSFLALEEMRYAVGRRVLAFPAGLVDENEKVLDAAKRELLEETGYHSKSWKSLGTCFPLPGLLAQKLHLFLASNIEHAQPQQLDAVEDIQLRFLSLDKLLQRFSKGGDIDGVSLAAFTLFASQNLSELRKKSGFEKRLLNSQGKV